MKTLLPFALAVSAVFASFAFADEAPKYPEFSLAFTGALNDGNTEDKSGNLATSFKDVWEGIGEYNVGADGTITRTTVSSTETLADGSKKTTKEENTTAKNGKVFGKVLFDVAGPVSVYLDGSAFADEIADVDYRYMIGPGFAFALVKDDNVNLSFELGVSGMWEKIAGESEYYTVLRVAEIFEYSFGTGAKIFEKFEYLPAFNDSDKYLMNAEAGIDSPVSDKLSLRIFAKDTYNSLPGDGHEKNDFSLNAGIVVKL